MIRKVIDPTIHLDNSFGYNTAFPTDLTIHMVNGKWNIGYIGYRIIYGWLVYSFFRLFEEAPALFFSP
jgi:hypothetical protein